MPSTDDFLRAAAHGNIDLLDQYLTDGFDIDAINNIGETALIETVKNNQIAACEFLLQKKSNPQIHDCSFGAIHFAAYFGREEITDLLIANDVEIDSLTKNDDSALMLALQEGYEDIAQAILQTNPDVTIRNKKGITALHLAASQGFGTIVQDLIVRGADTKAVGFDSENNEVTPLDLAEDEDVRAMLESQKSKFGARSAEQLVSKKQKTL